jgi:high affinity Mn2+ porin
MKGLHRLLPVLVVVLTGSAGAVADDKVASGDATLPESWSVHAQLTFTEQYHPAFRSPYRGTNSLDPGSRGDETADLTLFGGVRLWNEGELYANFELDQGFGLSNTLGVAAFPSGEAYKVGKESPYLRFHRAFFRQTIDLGGTLENVAPAANQLGHTRTTNNFILTVGKFSPTDIFDTNSYAHDPRADFMNWAIVDSGAFDYAADAWGYSYGVAGEWTQSWWTLRTGLFDLSTVPNTTHLETGFQQFEFVAEAEERHSWWGQDGKVKILGFVNRGRMGSYNDAIKFGIATSSTPNTALVRRYASRPGAALNLEQQITGDLGMFLRASINDGSEEAYEFTEINRSLALGISLKGSEWSRPQDMVGIALEMSDISKSAQDYLAAGGMGILIGDGQLPKYGSERILEVYYSAQVAQWLSVSADYQFIDNPAYAAERGPVSVLGARIHAEL